MSLKPTLESDSQQDAIYIWTMSLGQWRTAKTHGVKVLDITAKSGHRAFAPEFHNVMRYKRGELSEEQYAELYHQRMEQSKERLPKEWEVLLENPKVALACYCRTGTFCHRHLFLPFMKEYLNARDITTHYGGELSLFKPPA